MNASAFLVAGVAIIVLNEKNEMLTSLRTEQVGAFSPGFEVPMGKVK